MYKHIYISIFYIFLGFTFVCGQEISPEKMEEMMALAKPGPEHKMLEKLVGTWEQTIKFWMKPGSEPSVMHGKSVNTMILMSPKLYSKIPVHRTRKNLKW
jgi:hypothetical protein